MEIGEQVRLEWRRCAEFSAAQLYEVLRFRQAIFVVEQRCAYPDLDGLDEPAAHLLLRLDGELTGYARLIPHPEEARVAIGRVAVDEGRRRQGLARRLMAEAMARAGRDHSGWTVTLTAQTYLVAFYRGLGFRPVGEPFDDWGLMHVAMRLERE